jgi:hypothetical protein
MRYAIDRKGERRNGNNASKKEKLGTSFRDNIILNGSNKTYSGFKLSLFKIIFWLHRNRK